MGGDLSETGNEALDRAQHVELGNPQNVIYELPEEYRPVFDSHEKDEIQSPDGMALYDVSVQDLVEGRFDCAREQVAHELQAKAFRRGAKNL